MSSDTVTLGSQTTNAIVPEGEEYVWEEKVQLLGISDSRTSNRHGEQASTSGENYQFIVESLQNSDDTDMLIQRWRSQLRLGNSDFANGLFRIARGHPPIDPRDIDSREIALEILASSHCDFLQSELKLLIGVLLNNSHASLRHSAIAAAGELSILDRFECKAKVASLVETDEASFVRSAAQAFIRQLDRYNERETSY